MFIYVPSMHVYTRGELKMKSLKKVGVLALIMVALIIPAVAVCGNASGETGLYDDGVWVSGGFNDRSTGSITVRATGDITDGDVLTATITDLFSGHVFATRTITVVESDEERGYIDIVLSFRIGSPGKYFAIVELTGTNVSEKFNTVSTFSFDVGKSIWSNTWTYVAIIIVIILIAIVLILRMRASPKVEDTGAFTAMEEERQEKRKSSSKGAKKETYKGRQKKN